MSAPVKLPAIFSGIRSRVDRSYTLTFVSQELPNTLAAELLGKHQSMCELTIATEGDTDQAPEYKRTNPARKKSPSQTLRQEMWSYFQQAKLEGDFDEFYEKVIDAYVRHWHDKRVAL